MLFKNGATIANFPDRRKRGGLAAALVPMPGQPHQLIRGAILLAGVNVPMNLNLVCYSLLLLTAVGSALLPAINKPCQKAAQ
jgi:hypothetical protein